MPCDGSFYNLLSWRDFSFKCVSDNIVTFVAIFPKQLFYRLLSYFSLLKISTTLCGALDIIIALNASRSKNKHYVEDLRTDNVMSIYGAFVRDQSGIRIIGIMQVSVCLGAILIPEYLDSILAILLPGAEYIPEYILIPEYSQTNAPLVESWKNRQCDNWPHSVLILASWS